MAITLIKNKKVIIHTKKNQYLFTLKLAQPEIAIATIKIINISTIKIINI